MRKPISEHSTTIKAGKGSKSAPRDSLLEPVNGGAVRRVEFHEAAPEPTFTEEPARQYQARHDASIDQIHFEVDNLDRLSRGAPARARRPREAPVTRRVYDTKLGGVNESRMKTTHGERRVLYTSKSVSGRQHEERFHSGLVDRIISEKYNAGPSFDAVDDAAPKRKLLGRKKKAAEAVFTPEPAAEAEYQPQCGAITRDGVQCRNSCKDGSEYCGSHQTYAPQALEDLLDTKPAAGEDTKPGTGDSAGNGQCAAYTKESLQCKRNSRQGSKYCSVHKGYRAPSKASLTAKLDTKPRHAGAKDTVPKVR